MFSSTSHFSGKASWEESFGIPYPPLAVFSWDVLGCSIHFIQEVLWTMVKNLPSPGLERERGVMGKEKGHHPLMGSNQPMTTLEL